MLKMPEWKPSIVHTDRNKKTRFTRKCISEAIVDLLETTQYEKLRISAIVCRAGISRMSFYKYYMTPYDALTDYMNIIVSEYLEELNGEETAGILLTKEHLIHLMLFFDRYARFFLILSKYHLHSIMIDGINRFVSTNIETHSEFSEYKYYAYAGGLLNAFLHWEETGKRDRVENVAEAFYTL